MPPTSLSRLRIRSLLREAEYELAAGPHPDRARLDAEFLLLHVLRKSDPERNRAWLIAHADSSTMPNLGQEFRALTRRRLAGEPIQYITGEAEFYGLPFRVTRHVLIPRPETEHLVEKALELAARFEQLRIVDVGAGSGAIAVALAHALPQAQVTAIDLSPAALAVARDNAARNGVAGRIRFLHGNLLAPVEQERFEMVVSNPPYIASGERDSLAVEVREHEPEMALFAGPDGLAIYRKLIPAAAQVLSPGGYLLLEMGYGQQQPVCELMETSGLEPMEPVADLQGIARVACARRPGSSR